MKKYRKLNPISFPIKGTCLIEASAGTGKTYSIIIFYLRLLLGLNIKSFPHGLSVKEILLVTYTEFAKNQLKERIRKGIIHLKSACINKDETHPLFKEIKNVKKSLIKLIYAEHNIDEASIFTIHGFCHKMLSANLIESKFFLDKNTIEDESYLYNQISKNFWEKYCSKLPILISKIIFSYWKDSDFLLKDTLPFIKGEKPTILSSVNKKQSIKNFYYSKIIYINKIKRIWKKLIIKMLLKIVSNLMNANKKEKILKYINIIDAWSNNKTENFDVPIEIKKIKNLLKNHYKNYKNILQNIFFNKVDESYKFYKKLKELIFQKSIIKMREYKKTEKKNQEKLDFDDLIILFKTELFKFNKLSKIIRNIYPVAIIDEFQDTDLIQYKIFFKIYYKKKMCSLILIGDPKQAIYGFRGADIFTYIKIKNKIKNIYSLQTNWRSSVRMVNAVNFLFSRIKNPFIYKNINFDKALSIKKNNNLNFFIENKLQSAIEFVMYPKNNIGLHNYQKYMAEQYAIKIYNIINSSDYKKTYLENKYSHKNVIISDITILVRNRTEANFMKIACDKLSIPNIYLSDNSSVFHTLEAKDIIQILNAILFPENENIVRCALLTKMFGLTNVEIQKLNYNKKIFKKIILEFILYRDLWDKFGIMQMMNYILDNKNYFTMFNKFKKDIKYFSNIIHIVEILHETSKKIKNKHELLKWLYYQITFNDVQNENHKIRVFDEDKAVKIMTIFKSKGLQFPIVFLPFLSSFRTKKHVLFHSKKKYKLILDLKSTLKNRKLSDKERLSEDIRLFYVAITRAIYHCSIGICSLSIGNQTKSVMSHTHRTSIGYIIQKRKKSDWNTLKKYLENISFYSKGNISVNLKKNLCKKILKTNFSFFNIKKNIISNKKEDYFFKSISFSYIKKNNFNKLNYIYEHEKENKEKIYDFNTSFLPKGKIFGKFIHKIFEKLNFTKNIDKNIIKENLVKYEFDLSLTNDLAEWIKNIIKKPLNEDFLSLSRIKQKNKLTELKFYLSINSKIKEKEFNFLIKKYDPISSKCFCLKNINNINGILTGSVDLVFLWKKKYYFLDYKSNWLGENSSFYNKKNMTLEMIKHRYDIQYQIYSVAIHRYLKYKIKKYDYNKHFGGIYYLFVRGINNLCRKTKNGIYFIKPNYSLINKINKHFL
ncbi:recB [Wigglesworthia glossinidia endosymbiont of Glossina brevipalpis]|uniref:RecBCD enzyme subunit RecB n=1 Tax=Wigglesworthia glossinidia brevipalpis TaxID=36870 RepID=Q8D2T8_WIGBR|nr:recB [Wigglesworthia glossinidia endosymbiont of Glossina brevipalpis]